MRMRSFSGIDGLAAKEVDRRRGSTQGDRPKFAKIIDDGGGRNMPQETHDQILPPLVTPHGVALKWAMRIAGFARAQAAFSNSCELAATVSNVIGGCRPSTFLTKSSVIDK
ncbi:hypothetical protein Nepgr_013178 [Nepenthes gracilis]|uniref:Uncharacterized protein n=1 Tax=Nepenthes gracilis TaxID=150966 RepID=A0AAD3XNF3_NEPGR|nr:hypothetical protein Nepgr_013178 [Nepenthes gracilis]